MAGDFSLVGNLNRIRKSIVAVIIMTKLIHEAAKSDAGGMDSYTTIVAKCDGVQ